MLTLLRTNAENNDFKFLVEKLDAELKILDGEEHLFYAQLNKTNDLSQVVLVFENDSCIACGALREYEKKGMQVKRMYVLPTHRNKGIASMVLHELEDWAKELNCNFLVLETGKKQQAAMHLYERSGYQIISNYGKYKGMENSVCYEKIFNRE